MPAAGGGSERTRKRRQKRRRRQSPRIRGERDRGVGGGRERGRGHCSRKCRLARESIAYIAFGDPEVTESFRDYLNGRIDRSILWLSRKGYCLARPPSSAVFPRAPANPSRARKTSRRNRLPRRRSLVSPLPPRRPANQLRYGIIRAEIEQLIDASSSLARPLNDIAQ